jgi:hypothetical protein
MVGFLVLTLASQAQAGPKCPVALSLALNANGQEASMKDTDRKALEAALSKRGYQIDPKSLLRLKIDGTFSTHVDEQGQKGSLRWVISMMDGGGYSWTQEPKERAFEIVDPRRAEKARETLPTKVAKWVSRIPDPATVATCGPALAGAKKESNRIPSSLKKKSTESKRLR